MHIIFPYWLLKNYFLGSIIWLIVVAAIWGLSTPLLRHGSAGIEKVSERNAFNQWIAELYFLITNWKVSSNNKTYLQ